MKIHASGEDYLEAILVLQKKMGMVRSIDLARHMGFSKPSISHAVGVLKNGGFLTVDDLWSSLWPLALILKRQNRRLAGSNTPSVIHLSES